ncbi:MAG: ATP-binding protein [Lachnospiraceae bacterium]|nr:ATP-binding protein [Lachnospiraceae bacterium]
MPLTNEEYAKIQHIYEERRRADEYALAERLKEIRERIPAYRETEESIIDASVSCSRSLIGISDEGKRAAKLKELHETLDGLSKQKAELLAQYGYPADYASLHWQCEKCRDSGFVNGEKCSCFKQLEIDLLYDHSNLRVILEQNNFSLLSYDYYTGEHLRHFEEAVRECRSFIEDFDSEYRNLLFYGTVGTGKSFLSACVAKELLDTGHSIIYFSAQQLFQTISGSYYDKDKSELNSLYGHLYESDLLIIDDLGTEMVNEFTRTQLFNIINERALREHSTVISTNLELQQIRELYSDRLFSRLADHCRICHMTGKDIRLQKKLEAEYKKPL